ncbi:hypothetical protein BV898_18570 [Hypsibius exemplaris]|uniref:Uncharacterized protein n=1 Tax=Hypsibius exemplaris TaxID=2072580 RepID=A0A9X6RN56_HYPEX|nr:hypothetical protein BV898_18570 [Hypsibius exemplaris]
MAQALVITVFLVICLATIGSALNCFQCTHANHLPESSTNQVNCEDPFKADGIRSISKDETGAACDRCMQGKVTMQVGSETRVGTLRGCYIAGEASAIGAAICTTNNCNTGVAPDVIVPSPPPTTVAPALNCFQCTYAEHLPESFTNQVNCKDPFKADGIRSISKDETGADCDRCMQGKITVQVGSETRIGTLRGCYSAGVASAIGAAICTTSNCNTGVAPDVPVPTQSPGGSSTETSNGMPKLIASAGLVLLGTLVMIC